MKKLLIGILLLLSVSLSAQLRTGVMASSRHTVTASSLITGLVSYWKLDETSGAAADVKNVTNLPVYNATINQVGNIGRAYQFAATGYLGVTQDYAGGSKNVNYEFTSAMTVSCWVRTTTAGAYHTIVSNYYASADQGWDLGVEGAGNRFTFYVGSPLYTPTGISVMSTTVENSGAWVHIVGTWDGTYTRIYVNGILENTSIVWNHNITYNALNSFYIAQRYDELRFTGYIDGVGLWSVCLTPAQVTELHSKEDAGQTYPWTPAWDEMYYGTVDDAVTTVDDTEITVDI